MANKIILKKSSVASKVPLASDLEVAEVAVNLADKKLYSKDAGGNVIQLASGNLTEITSISSPDYIQFNTTPATTPTTTGALYWNSSDGTADLVMRGGNVVQQIGEEAYYTARNATGSTIANGTPVMATGVTAGSGRIEISPAIADGSIDELRFIGLTTESISNGVNGYVTCFGYVRGLDTRGTPYGETWAEGDIIYVSPTTAGWLTNVEPIAPNLKIVVAIVITRHQTQGVLLVRPTAYPHITHLSDVQITTPSSGQVLTYDGSIWKNETPTAPSSPITFNTTNISQDYTIASGQNGFSVGPVTIDSGYSVTVASGQRWVVI